MTAPYEFKLPRRLRKKFEININKYCFKDNSIRSIIARKQNTFGKHLGSGSLDIPKKHPRKAFGYFSYI
jgi:hypothetical protein